jgi:quinol monooxygenase YgiN
MEKRTRFIVAAAALSTIPICSQPLSAQPAGEIRSILRVRVKPDRVADYRAAVAEMNAVMRKAGVTRRLYRFQSLSGPNEFVTVSHHSRWAELDSSSFADPKLQPYAGEVAAILARMGAASESRERIVDVAMPELSLPQAPAPPPRIQVHKVRVKPDRFDDYVALLKSDLLPAYRESGLRTFTVGRTRFGGSRYEMTSVTSVNHWADFDGESPLRRAMGNDGYQAFLKKVRPMVDESAYGLFRYLADLSYAPAAVAVSAAGK